VKKRPRLRLVGNGGGGTAIFDDIEKLRADLETAAAATTTPPEGSVGQTLTQRRQPETETFARIPHDRGLELYRRRRISGPAWAVLIELDRMILTQRGKNLVFFWSPRLWAAGLVRGVRARALRQLAAAGVIEVEWRKKGLSPLVRHLWYRGATDNIARDTVPLSPEIRYHIPGDNPVPSLSLIFSNSLYLDSNIHWQRTAPPACG
jgi:hypothetical protein